MASFRTLPAFCLSILLLVPAALAETEIRACVTYGGEGVEPVFLSGVRLVVDESPDSVLGYATISADEPTPGEILDGAQLFFDETSRLDGQYDGDATLNLDSDRIEPRDASARKVRGDPRDHQQDCYYE